MRIGVHAAVLLLAIALGAAAQAAESTDPNWPCIQRKIPSLSAGMMWAGPAVDESDESWRADKDVADLVAAVAPRRVSLDDANAAIDRYAARLGADKDRRLTLVFTGLLQTINAERSEILAGIERYARKQATLADKVKARTRELSALRQKQALSDAEREKMDSLEEQLVWDTRVFDERTRSLRYVCESPVMLEQRLFALARQLMSHLD
jgi:hypothetical protein